MSMKTRWEPIKDDRFKYSNSNEYCKVTLVDQPVTPLGKNYTFSHCNLERRYQPSIDRIIDLDVFPDDVWICSIPRSGTHWVVQMAWLILNDLDYKAVQDRKVFRWLRNVADSCEAPRPRFIMNHLPVSLLPSKIWTVKPKMFYVMRNPKDAAISFYHYHRDFFGFIGSLEDFLGLYSEQLMEFGPYPNHINEYWQLRNEENVFFLTFEEMKSDLCGVIQRVSTFLGKELSPDQVQDLANHLTLDGMKKTVINEKYGATENQKHFRRGEIGSFKTEMPPEFIEKFDQIIEKDYKGQ